MARIATAVSARRNTSQYDNQEYELFEGGVAFLPKGVPHGYRITSSKAFGNVILGSSR
jgi:quercetin dioxygenase-like cupin family protein